MQPIQKHSLPEHEDWTFPDQELNAHIHGLHLYPARMHPPVARRAIELFASERDLILDPFCGSGGVLAEARIKGYRSIGIDINPLACLLSRVKTTPLNPNLLSQKWKLLLCQLKRNLQEPLLPKIVEDLEKASKIDNKKKKTELLRSVRNDFEENEFSITDFSSLNLLYWFKPKTVVELAVIKNCIDNLLKGEVRDFFYVCLSKTVRCASGTRKGEFKLYRIPEAKWEKFNPATLEIFTRIVTDNIVRMADFHKIIAESNFVSPPPIVILSDTRKIFSNEFSRKDKNLLFEYNGSSLTGKVNLIITSPPYGDSGTTVAYGQFSRYLSFWLGFRKEDYYDVDRWSLGGKDKDEKLESMTLNQVLKAIDAKNQKRALQIKSFYVDLNICLGNLYKVLASNGKICFVLGNRNISGFRIPTDQILVELAKSFGFEYNGAFSRSILKKRIPWKSSPTNTPGEKIETISEERIVVLGK